MKLLKTTIVVLINSHQVKGGGNSICNGEPSIEPGNSRDGSGVIYDLIFS